MRRRFNRGERAALFLAADGKCSDCGNLLEVGWHSDHIQPYVHGGTTDVINGQALCQPCNLKKGASMPIPPLYDWQVRALEDLSKWKPLGDTGFLLEATPGAGKTRWAIEATIRAFRAGTIDRVIIAVPTARLETQWAEKFAPFGFHINPDWHASVGVLPADEQGCAATFAEIAKQPAVFRKLTSQAKTLVVGDEIHHCASERAWGDGIGEAFAPARIKLLLSGTPFRSDNHEIPFVNYVDGTGVPDHRYGYAQALDDRVVRPVWFPRRGGTAEWIFRGEECAASFDDALSAEAANRRLRTALSAHGDWLPAVLKDANQQLAELRITDPTAGGIVFAEDAYAARAIVSIFSSMGVNAVLAISEERDSQHRIAAFEAGTAPWLVSIRQVSEGVDIPRLRVGVYATNYLTEMFFRQALGRLVRRRENEDDPTAYLYIPDDQRLRAMAETIKQARDHVLNRQLQEVNATVTGSAEKQPSQQGLFHPIASSAEDRGIIVDADTITPEQFAEAERIKRQASDTRDIPTPLVATLLKSAGFFNLEQAPPAPTASAPTPKRRKDSLRTENNVLVGRIAARYDGNHGHLNHALNKAVGVTNIRQCTEDQYKQRLMLAEEWLTDGPPPEAL